MLLTNNIMSISPIQDPFQRSTGLTLTDQNVRKICVDIISPRDRQLKTHTLKGLQTLFGTKETDLERLKAAFMLSKLWPSNSTIAVGFLASNTNEQLNPDSWAWKRAWVAKVITDQFAPYLGVTFQFNLNPAQGNQANLRISFDPTGGCYSRLGTDALQNWGGLNETMNFGWMDAPTNHTFTYNNVSYTTPGSFDQGGYLGEGTTITHEFGHAMGMIHEHQTPFNNPLEWNRDYVYSIFTGPPNNWTREEVDYNIIDTYSTTGMNGSSFDGRSVMKYYIPSELLLNPTPQVVQEIERINYYLSACDKYWLAYNYPGRVSSTDLAVLQTSCAQQTTGIPTNPPTGGGGGSGLGSAMLTILLVLLIILILAAYLGVSIFKTILDFILRIFGLKK
jgi:hypothetical protein